MTLKSEELSRRNKLKDNKPLVYDKILKFNEKLKRGESIAIIQLQYKYDCQFHCAHCAIKRFQNKREVRKLNPSDVNNIFQQADELGLARVTITGGEPLLFKDLDDLVKAINPEKFYINCDTNGFLLTDEKAKYLKKIGVDRIQLSIDSLIPEEHDRFRGVKGAHKRAMQSVAHTLNANLEIFIQTVVTHDRLYSDEFIKFIEHFNSIGIGVFITYAKPVGNWEGNFNVLINKDDMNYMRELEKKYNVFTHLTSAYGLNMGCIAMKGMFSITQFGDVLPCPYIHISIGNIFNEPLKDIIQRGMNIKYFGQFVDTCLIAEDRDFINKFIVNGTYNKELPVPWQEVFKEEDFIIKETINIDNEY